MLVENVYPVIADPYVLHLTPHEGYLRDVSVAPNVNKGDTHMLNDVATDLMSRCDGRTTLGSLLSAMAMKYQGEGFDMGVSCRDYFAELVGEGLIDLHSTPVDGMGLIRGSRDYECPSHFMIELTDQCNLRCAHCYRHSSPECDAQISTPKLLGIIDQMHAHGVSTIELTGGEPTMRADFLEIFHHCAARFNSVAIITNGWFITDSWARQMAEYDNVIVQVDLDGSHAKSHDTLRGREGSFEHSKRAGYALAKHGVRYRAAMNLYRGNFDTIRQTADLAREIGANWFSFSPVTDMGRGREADIISFDQMAQLMDIAKDIEAVHGPDFLRLADEDLLQRAEDEGNCGAGWRSLVLGPDGRVRPCVMVEPKAMDFGNLLEQDYVSFLKGFDGSFFRALGAPGPETCSGCPNDHYCQGCFARTLNANALMLQDLGEMRCHWRQHTGFESFVEKDC